MLSHGPTTYEFVDTTTDVRDVTALVRRARAAGGAGPANLDRLQRFDPETGEIYPDGPRLVQAAPRVYSSPDEQQAAQRAADVRRSAYQLQAGAARLMSSERVALCHRLPSGSLVDVRRAAGRSYLSGVQTCGSVWMCPLCAKKITEGRRREVQQLAEFVRGGGGQLLFLTLTAPHTRDQTLTFLQDAMTSAYRLLVSGKNALSRVVPGYLGAVRAQEVTHGSNGWHVHFHVLLAVGEPLSEPVAASLVARLSARWQGCALKAGLDAPSDAHGLRLDVASVHGLDVDAVTDYVCKWGAAEELTKLHTKQGRGESRSPWGLLADYMAGLDQAGALFREYARIFKGARQLVWSTGLRALAGLLEWSDEDLAAHEPDVFEVVGRLTRHQWAAVRAVGDRSTLLDLADYRASVMWVYIGRCCAAFKDAGNDRLKRDELKREAAILLMGGGI